MKRRGIGVLTALLLVASLMAAGPAEAAPGRIVVEDGESIQAAIDAADEGTEIVIRGHHVENLWVNKAGLSLIGQGGASLTLPEDPTVFPCSNPDNPQNSAAICVFPPSALVPGPPDPANNMNGVLITGLTIEAPTGEGIVSVFTDRVYVRRNTISNFECAGIAVIFATKFDIDNNHVSAGQFCNVIDILGSQRGRVSNNVASGSPFAAIGLGESSYVTVRDNHVSDSCFGIVVADGQDDGFGGIFDADRMSTNVTVLRNTATGNNTACQPFGPEGPSGGGNGIVIAGSKNALVKNNTVVDNVLDGFSFGPGGIFVGDFPNPDGSVFSIASGAVVVGNTATGNSTLDGVIDIALVSEVPPRRVDRNICGVSIFDPTICSGTP